MRSRLVSVKLPADGAGLTLPEAQRLRERVRNIAAENDRLRAEMLEPAKPTVAAKVSNFFSSVSHEARESLKQFREQA